MAAVEEDLRPLVQCLDDNDDDGAVAVCNQRKMDPSMGDVLATAKYAADVDVHTTKVDVLIGLGKFQEAVSACQAAEKAGVPLQFERGYSLYKLGKSDEAIEAAGAAEDQSPTGAPSRLVAQSLYRSGQFKEAADRYAAIVKGSEEQERLIEINAAASLVCAGNGADTASLPAVADEEQAKRWDAAYAGACAVADRDPRAAARLAHSAATLRASALAAKGSAPKAVEGSLALPRLLRGVLLARARHAEAARDMLKKVEASRPVDASLPGLASLARARAAHFGAVLPSRAAAAGVRQARLLASSKLQGRLTPGQQQAARLAGAAAAVRCGLLAEAKQLLGVTSGTEGGKASSSSASSSSSSKGSDVGEALALELEGAAMPWLVRATAAADDKRRSAGRKASQREGAEEAAAAEAARTLGRALETKGGKRGAMGGGSGVGFAGMQAHAGARRGQAGAVDGGAARVRLARAAALQAAGDHGEAFAELSRLAEGAGGQSQAPALVAARAQAASSSGDGGALGALLAAALKGAGGGASGRGAARVGGTAALLAGKAQEGAECAGAWAGSAAGAEARVASAARSFAGAWASLLGRQQAGGSAVGAASGAELGAGVEELERGGVPRRWLRSGSIAGPGMGGLETLSVAGSTAGSTQGGGAGETDSVAGELGLAAGVEAVLAGGTGMRRRPPMTRATVLRRRARRREAFLVKLRERLGRDPGDELPPPSRERWVPKHLQEAEIKKARKKVLQAQALGKAVPADLLRKAGAVGAQGSGGDVSSAVEKQLDLRKKEEAGEIGTGAAAASSGKGASGSRGSKKAGGRRRRKK